MSCPHREGASCHSDAMDPSTNMPKTLETPPSPEAQSLSASRETSSIPRTGDSRWMYPSPMMFYNALKRKGFDTAPEDIDVMVDVHNFLNEGVWKEVLKWEEMHKEECAQPALSRFRGRPTELSPKAWIYHNIYRGPKPFDRHDWVIDRCGKEVRYVIDYYSSNEEGSFNVDVRPALDSPIALFDRLKMAYNKWRNI